MAKKKKQEFFLNKYYKFLVIIFSFACFGIMFAPSLALSVGGINIPSINMWEAGFGIKYIVDYIISVQFNFSILVLLIPLLIAVGGVLPFFITRNAGTVISLGCFVTAAVFSLMLPVLAMPNESTADICDITLSVGGILVCVLSIICSGLSITKLVV